MKNFLLVFVLCCLSACSTKNYGRLSPLTSTEKKDLTCREIDIEISKVSGFLDMVEDESSFDVKSVLSFLGDFGIGNVMEKDAAIKSARIRLKQLHDLKAQKNCSCEQVNH